MAVGAATILLVDDQNFVGMAVTRLLQSEADLQLQCCLESETAIARANEIAPDLILQDLVMPGIDGISLVKMYRENPATSQTPIVVLSANDDPALRQQAREAGATDYLVKLPPKADLVSCLRKHLDGSGASAMPGLKTRPPETRLPEDNVLDLSVIADFCGSNLEDASAFVLILIGQFLKEASNQVAAVQFAATNDDRALLKLAAHRLKGGAATMGARRLAAVCDQLEHELARPGRPTPEDLVKSVLEEVDRAREACEAVRKRYEPNS